MYSPTMPMKGTSRMSAALMSSAATMTVRRESQSAITPASGAAKVGGTSRRTSTTAIAAWSPLVSAKAAAMKARVATQSPSDDTDWPMSSRRNP
jgi:hypothetical protein